MNDLHSHLFTVGYLNQTTVEVNNKNKELRYYGISNVNRCAYYKQKDVKIGTIYDLYVG